jgi:transmembrane sensor
MKDDASRPATPPQPAQVTHDNTVLDWARGSGAGDLLAGGLEHYLRRQRRRRLALVSTACAVLFVVGAIWISFRETASMAPVSTSVASATILRPEQRTLPDGSTIDLNAGAEIEVTFSNSFRRVVLRKGEAHFQVTKDALRPFVVTAGAVEVLAVGTAFSVDFGTSAVDVLVTEGRVAVNTTAPSTAMVNPGNPSAALTPPLAALESGKRVVIERDVSAAAAIAPPLVLEISLADMQARLAWRVPRLKFAATPLAQVVAMFNEHAVAGRDARLILAPDVSPNLRVSGLLRADDVDSLLRLLAGEFGISAETRTGEIILRRP